MVEKKELILFESGFLYGKGWLLVNGSGDSNKYGCIRNKIETKRGCRSELEKRRFYLAITIICMVGLEVVLWQSRCKFWFFNFILRPKITNFFWNT